VEGEGEGVGEGCAESVGVLLTISYIQSLVYGVKSISKPGYSVNECFKVS